MQGSLFSSQQELSAKRALMARVDDWLGDVGIGGSKDNAHGGGNRGFDPTELIAFAWERQLEAEGPEEIYRLFVDAQQVRGKRGAAGRVRPSHRRLSYSVRPAAAPPFTGSPSERALRPMCRRRRSAGCTRC